MTMPEYAPGMTASGGCPPASRCHLSPNRKVRVMTRQACSLASRILGKDIERFNDMSGGEAEQVINELCDKFPADAWVRIAAGGTVRR